MKKGKDGCPVCKGRGFTIQRLVKDGLEGDYAIPCKCIYERERAEKDWTPSKRNWNGI